MPQPFPLVHTQTTPRLQEPGQKIIDVDTAAQMVELAMPDGRFVRSFAQYLREQRDYKKLNEDQWLNFYRCSCSASLPCSY